MDNNNQNPTSTPPVQTPTPAAPPVTPQPMVTQPQPVQPNPTPSSTPPLAQPEPVHHGPNKLIVISIAALIIAILVGGIYVLYTQVLNPKPATPETQDTANLAPLSTEINSVTEEDVDKEFTEVDADLQGLEDVPQEPKL